MRIPDATLREDAKLELTTILSEYFGGKETHTTLRQVRETVRRNHNAFDLTDDFYKFVVRECDRRMALMTECAGSC